MKHVQTGGPPDGLSEWVEQARGGSREAMAELYRQTYRGVCGAVKTMIRSEEDVCDIVQDTYVKAFTHLDQFQPGTRFLPWVRQIAANTARDFLKKKRPTLFTDLASGEPEVLPAEEALADERSGVLPEQVLDQAETRRLLAEILDRLPEDQRLVIALFYYEERSVREIAALLDLSESAVKSRLLYGRRKIEKQVRALEKEGTKLYGLAPIPFLLLLFRGQKADAAVHPDGQVLRAVLDRTARASSPSASAAAGASGGGAGAGGLSAAKLGLIALAVAAVGGAGLFGASRLGAQPPETPPVAAVESAGPVLPSLTPSPTPEPTPVPDPVDLALEQYRLVLKQAGQYAYGGGTPTGNYRYALVQLEPEDPVPTLLLAQETDDFLFHTRLFRYDPDTGTLQQPGEPLEEGAGGGGSRSGLTLEGDGRGLRLTQVSGGTGACVLYRVTLRGDTLEQSEQWSGPMDQIPAEPGFREIP